ncbi:efflux transporter outer membrane subunit [Solimonas soli]|uniref:efflux transporter outer membrane subunit n=1 Tax=Solimonas soli TaxID=413479 RepID=UPI000482A556|nr:efflux transporter outer membrane subunit [Solimonas soli]
MNTSVKGFARNRPALAIAATVLATGCAVGPDFKTPEATKTDRYTAEALPQQTVSTDVAGGEAQTLRSGATIPAQWWQLYGSELISQRIDQAFTHSPTVSAAQAALRQAQENFKAASGSYFPRVDGNASVTRQKINSATLAPGSSGGYLYNVYGASVDVSYTLDLFGGVRRSVEAQAAQAEYQQYQLEGTYLTLASNVVTATVQEASLQAQVTATEDIIKALEEQQRITEKQYELGGVALTDVLAARTQLEAIRATIPALRQQLAQTRNQLAIYLGRLPSEQEAVTLDLAQITLPQDVPLSLPSQLARQRPDIRAAEAQLHAASANVGVATANLYPSLTISGSYGSQAGRDADLFKSASEVWSVAAGLAAPILHGGELRARKRAAVAAYDEALANYQQTVLQAFANVADSLHALSNDADALHSRHAALTSAEKNLDLVQRSYRAGAVGYLNVLDAQQQHQQAKINFINAQAARYSDTAALLQALGGGWWNRDAQSTTASAQP